MLARGTKAEIIAHLIEHCQRLMELPLGFLEVDDDVYVGPSEPEEVVRTLTARFSIESLLEPDNFVPLDRRTDILGFRLALAKPDARDGLFNLRIESFAQDARSLFIENVGTFRYLVEPQNLKDLGEKFAATYGYIENHVVPFLAQFDDAPSA